MNEEILKLADRLVELTERETESVYGAEAALVFATARFLAKRSMGVRDAHHLLDVAYREARKLDCQNCGHPRHLHSPSCTHQQTDSSTGYKTVKCSCEAAV